MAEAINLTINGKQVRVHEGTSVAAAVLMSGKPTRISVHGDERTPFCGMGICMECRATVNGIVHQRTCQLACEAGMEVVSG